METNEISANSNFNAKKKKCLTISEYNEIVNRIDSLINDKNDFILNKYEQLKQKTISDYPQLDENTVISIVDARVQYYVRHRHHKVFNNVPCTITPNQSPMHNQEQCNKRLMNSTITLYDRYKELAANGSVTSPLITLANNLRMPAMLVAKTVLSDHIYGEKLNVQLNQQIHDCSNVLNNSNLQNDNSSVSGQDDSVNNLSTTELDVSSSSIDTQLSHQLDWLTNKLLSMYSNLPVEELNESDSAISSNSYSKQQTTIKSLNLSNHQLASSTWLIHTDPCLAYEVYKCSVIDGHYGICFDFIKNCTGKRFEQLLQQSMTHVTADTKSQKNIHSLYITEKECRIRGLDMTPDMVLNEPIAILLSDNENTNYNTTYEGNYNAIRVLNWIESKAMFGGPDQLRTAMQCQLFPYWNRYGPGAIIYWFGHILEDNEKDQNTHTGVSMNKRTINNASTDRNVITTINTDLTESRMSNFWSKYCLLMDGFPTSDRIVMHNRQNPMKKKNSTTLTSEEMFLNK